MSNHDSLRVAVLLGGRSAEREVSLASGICVAAALEEAGHRVRGIDPAEVSLVEVDWRMFDACFIALHGGAGEDGRVQRLLDTLDVPYTGSGAVASRLAMSKQSAKERFLERGIPTPAFVSLHISESIREMQRRAARCGRPVIIKPDGQGSSLGVSLARTDDDFQRAIADGQFYDRFLLAEQYIAGREFTVAVIERQPLPLLEILSSSPLFSYEGKYRHTGTEFRFDTDLPASKVRRLQQVAVAAAEAIGTAGLARVDLRLDDEGEPWVLEINTVPGMTEQSLAPRAAAEGGIDMPTLCDRLLRACLQRQVTT